LIAGIGARALGDGQRWLSLRAQPNVITRTGMSEIAAWVVPEKLQTLNVTWPLLGTRWP